jgi:hypothetical protein
MRHHITLCLFLLLTSSVAANGSQLKLAAVFSDHMVLQRDMPVRVWGEARLQPHGIHGIRWLRFLRHRR